MKVLGVGIGIIIGMVVSSLVSFWTLLVTAVTAFLAKKFLRGKSGSKATRSKSFRHVKDEDMQERPTLPRGRTGVLAGVRVLELANTLAAPVVGRYLADLGAEVFKV